MKRKKEEIKKVVMLFSMSFLPHQGRYLRVYNEARTLIGAGKGVTLIAWDRDCKSPQEDIVDGIKIERVWSNAGFQQGPSNILNVLVFYIKLLPRLFRKEADVIHCFNLDTILPGLFVAKVKGKKAVLDLCEPQYYTNWPKRYRFFVNMLQSFEQFFSRKFDSVLVHNLYQMRKFQKYGTQTLEQIGSYPNKSLIADHLEEKKNDSTPLVIGRIGSIYKNNGIEETVDAFKKLAVSNANLKLLLAGKVFKEFKEEFEHLISTLNGKIEVTGEFSPEDLPKLYDKIDISLQLSRRTDWFKNITPTKFFETLAHGIPVITSDIGELKEIIAEYNCGIVVDETNPESVYAGLKKMVDHAELRLKMAENGLMAIKERYNWDIMGQKLLSVYQELESK